MPSPCSITKTYTSNCKALVKNVKFSFDIVKNDRSEEETQSCFNTARHT